jgi:PTS system nitrogen regulatory IIA component
MLKEIELSHVLAPERVLVLESATKKEALETLAECLATASEIQDGDALLKAIFYREGLMSTGIGMGIAVPHVRLASVTGPVMCVGICRNPLTDYESLDGVPVRLLFMIAAGQGQHVQYLRLLSSLSLRFKDDDLRDALMSASDPKTFYRILVDAEK